MPVRQAQQDDENGWRGPAATGFAPPDIFIHIQLFSEENQCYHDLF
jgi:hypothetical protein